MPEIMTCSHCKEKIKANPRLKGNQKYCKKAECQRERKRIWQQEKMKNDKDYRDKQIIYIKQWRKKNPWDQCMSKYRDENPEYEKINRQKQRKRNQTRREREKSAKIVEMDSLSLTSIKTNTYEMRPFHWDSTGKIVEMDSLMVELKPIQPLSFKQPAFRG
jgi:hypothetical protein